MNLSTLYLKRLEYGLDGKPAYAEYDGYGTLLSYTPVEAKYQWKPWPVIIGVVLGLWVGFTAISGYMENREYAQNKARFMEHAVLTKRWSVDRASKAWDEIQNGPDDQHNTP